MSFVRKKIGLFSPPEITFNSLKTRLEFFKKKNTFIIHEGISDSYDNTQNDLYTFNDYVCFIGHIINRKLFCGPPSYRWRATV